VGNIGPPKAEIVGAIVGAAAVITIVVYLAIPKQSTIEGCVESTEGGLRLTDDQQRHIYALATGNVNLQPGQRFTLKGKKGEKSSDAREFEVRKVVKTEGSCKEHSNLLIPIDNAGGEKHTD
jgi:hypothetical protein